LNFGYPRKTLKEMEKRLEELEFGDQEAVYVAKI
jgi:hypothetical protein